MFSRFIRIPVPFLKGVFTTLQIIKCKYSNKHSSTATLVLLLALISMASTVPQGSSKFAYDLYTVSHHSIDWKKFCTPTYI